MMRWNQFRMRVVKSNRLLFGLRVVEVHPGTNLHGISHGLHFHALFSQRLCIHWVRRLSEELRLGFGKIDIQKVDIDGALYLGKYLTKDQPELAKGMRRWGSFNWPECNRKNDIEIDSNFTRNMRKIQDVMKVSQVTPDIVQTVFTNTRLFGDWPWPVEKYYYSERSRKFFNNEDWRGHLGEKQGDAGNGMFPRRNKLTREQSMQNVAVHWTKVARTIAKRRGIPHNSAPQGKKIFNDKVSKTETVVKLDTTDYVLDRLPRKWSGMALATK